MSWKPFLFEGTPFGDISLHNCLKTVIIIIIIMARGGGGGWSAIKRAVISEQSYHRLYKYIHPLTVQESLEKFPGQLKI